MKTQKEKISELAEVRLMEAKKRYNMSDAEYNRLIEIVKSTEDENIDKRIREIAERILL